MNGNEKVKLKKGSVQLPEVYWDFIEARTIPGLLSGAAIVRNATTEWIKKTLLEEIDKVTIKNIHEASDGIIADFGDLLHFDEDLIYKSADVIKFQDSRENIVNFVQSMEYEIFIELSSNVRQIFYNMTEIEFIKKLAEGNY